MIDLIQYKKCFIQEKVVTREIVCSENRSKYVLKNKSSYKVCKIQVDNCICTGKDGEKCDYLLRAENGNTKLLFLVELKGRDILKAVSQLEQSLIKLSITVKSGYKVFGRIVPTSSYGPDIRSTAYKSLDNKFRTLKGNLKCHTQNFDII